MQASLIASLGLRRMAVGSPVVRPADVMGNVANTIAMAASGEALGADVIVFPELGLTGYTCGDLIMQDSLLEAAMNGVESIRTWTETHRPMLIVGLPLVVATRLYNVACVIQGGRILGIVPKTMLPNAQEFYDARWFTGGHHVAVCDIRIGSAVVPFGTDLLFEDANDARFVLGIEICEDLWSVIPPSSTMSLAGATIIANLSASNDLAGKAGYRRALVSQQSARTYTAYAYASAGIWESTTDTVFGGHLMIAEAGEMLAENSPCSFDASIVMGEIDLDRLVAERRLATSFKQEPAVDSYRRVLFDHVPAVHETVARRVAKHPFVPEEGSQRNERCHEIFNLQVAGLAVRMTRASARRLVIGVSGGLDSTLALLVCVEACRRLKRPLDDILAISMPGFGTTDRTRNNAEQLASTLGIPMRVISIAEAVRKHFADIGHDGMTHDVVFENAQARERTQILMDVANGENGIVVGTGDMSELALGWCTYNADQMSMYGVNAGVPKTLVRHLIEWYADSMASAPTAAILGDVLVTPISPELLPPGEDGAITQKTEDMIGPYELHDFFLYHLVRHQASVRKIAVLASVAFDGIYSPAVICHWLDVFLRRFISQQFKRSSMPDGVKVGSVALSPRTDWRMPSDASAAVWRAELEEVRRHYGIGDA